MKYLPFFLFVVLVFACKPKWEESLIYGQWDTVSWTENASGKKIGNQMDFDFKSDGSYLVDYGKTKSGGEYWLANDYLHTVEKDKAEIKVLILNLTQDSLKLELNRGGTMETMILLKQ